LLCRAEAYVHLGQYELAAADLNIWQKATCNEVYTNGGVTYTLATLTPAIINDFFGNFDYAPVPLGEKGVRSIKKKLNPQGFTVTAGDQENFIHCVLHFRRLENLHDGQRWVDIKRYGIEVEHNRDGYATSEILKVNDPRRALQLPQDVIDAGLAGNPR